MIFGEPAFPEWQGSASPPHVADKILNHQGGTISGVAAVYQRHDFLAERREALEKWAAHVREIIGQIFESDTLRRVA